MTNKHPILRVNSDGQVESACLFDSEHRTIEPIVDWSAERKRSWVAVLPAEWFYQTETQVASKHAEILRKSIPYAIEEELSNEVEDNHFAFRITGESSQSVAAVEKQSLEGFLAWAKAQGVSLASIRAELDWLPQDGQTIQVWTEEERSLLRLGDHPVMALPNAQVTNMLSMYASQYDHIRCNDPNVLGDLAHDQFQALTHIDCLQAVTGEAVFEFYLEELKAAEQEGKANSNRSLWLAAGVLALSWIGIQAYQYLMLNTSVNALKQQQTDLLQAHFTDAAGTELLDPFAAMSSRLRQHNSPGQANQASLSQTIQYLAVAQQRSQQVELRGLRLVDNQYEVQIKGPSMAQINAFHQLLQNNAPQYRVQIGVNELKDDGSYESIITMVKP